MFVTQKIYYALSKIQIIMPQGFTGIRKKIINKENVVKKY